MILLDFQNLNSFARDISTIVEVLRDRQPSAVLVGVTRAGFLPPAQDFGLDAVRDPTQLLMCYVEGEDGFYPFFRQLLEWYGL